MQVKLAGLLLLTSVGLKFNPLSTVLLVILSERNGISAVLLQAGRCTQLRSLGWNSSLSQSMW